VPPDIEQEGPRLTELGFTSATYGKFINIPFGTVRIDGNFIDNENPTIEEVISEESDSGGKGGGQKVTTTTYTYFLTGRISFAISGATDLVRLWADGKLIYDAAGTGKLVEAGIDITFYPGGLTQVTDAEEVSRRGAQIPAYRHLTSVKINRMPLANFARHVPNFTAEIAYNSSATTPATVMDEESFSLLMTQNYHLIDEGRNRVYSFRTGLDPNPVGTWSANVSDLKFQTKIESSGLQANGATAGLDGFVYHQDDSNNASATLEKRDAETGAIVDTVGTSGGGTTDTATKFGNSGRWFQLQVSTLGVGEKSILMHLNDFGGSNGSLVDADEMLILHTITSADMEATDTDFSYAIPDHDRNTFYTMTRADSNTTFQLVKWLFILTLILPTSPGGLPSIEVSFTATELRRFTRGDPGDDFENANDITGWAVDKTTGRLILSNNFNMVLYDPETDTIIAKRQNLGFVCQNNYFQSNRWAFSNTGGGNETISVIDTRDLTTVKTIDTTTIDWPSGSEGTFRDSSTVWDESTQAIIVRRIGSAPVDERFAKIFINRVVGTGVGLDTIATALSTSYQGIIMAGLDDADIDVTTLASHSDVSYNINRRSLVKSAFEPLRKNFFFDVIQSDWKIKFPLRGAASVLSIPEQDVGELRRGRTETDDPAVREIRTQDIELPMSIAVRYPNRDIDYNVDIEHAKRVVTPSATMNSKTEKTIDIPVIGQPTVMKRVAEEWLYTTWVERRQFKNVIPWTYLKLDPSDVFTMTVFGESFNLRMTDVDLGQGFAMDIASVQEDSKTFSSTNIGGNNSGFTQATIAGRSTTRLVFLDAPLLSIKDLTLGLSFNGYVAIGGFEDSWPGATLNRSIDGVDYSAAGSVNSEMAIAKITVVPSAWQYNAVGNFANRFQDVADGGTMTIAPIRRSAAWASAANELAVFNGANTMAVVTSGGVEIIQFETVVLNADNTITLNNLLRGRIGTEDVSDADTIAVGDEIVLLAGATGTTEAASIVRQPLPISQINTSLAYKGVTIGTLIEDAVTRLFTYTARDLKPYRVAQLTAVDTTGDAVVNWVRRTRGANVGEWLDGTGTVPLNESIEQYEVIITDGDGDTITRTVDDATTTTFTSGDLSGATGGAGDGIDLATATVSVRQTSGALSTIKSAVYTVNVT